jgi:hypothetical protein
VRTCPKCQTDKPLSSFYKNRAKTNGASSYCKECNAERQKAWKKKNPKKAGNNQRRYALMKLYGITEEQYDELLQKQGGSCGVCKRPASQFRNRLAVDHDHHTRAIRGLLCTMCNRNVIGRHRAGLGGVELFAHASEYLKQDTGWLVPEKRPRKRRKRK